VTVAAVEPRRIDHGVVDRGDNQVLPAVASMLTADQPVRAVAGAPPDTEPSNAGLHSPRKDVPSPERTTGGIVEIATIGSGWLVGPPTLLGESIEHRWAANHTVNTRKTAGGMLYLTNRRIVFTPHRISWAFGCVPWAIHLHDIASVDRLDPTMTSSRDGSLRARLCITLTDRRTEVLVVRHFETVIGTLAAAVSKTRDNNDDNPDVRPL
jgi:hypothetical protein